MYPKMHVVIYVDENSGSILTFGRYHVKMLDV